MDAEFVLSDILVFFVSDAISVCCQLSNSPVQFQFYWESSRDIGLFEQLKAANISAHQKNNRRSGLNIFSDSSSPDEGLEGSTLRVDAQRHTFSLLVLRDEAMDQLWCRDREARQ